MHPNKRDSENFSARLTASRPRGYISSTRNSLRKIYFMEGLTRRHGAAPFVASGSPHARST